MDLDFWEQRWNQNQIAFHLPEVNPYLGEYWHNFNVPENSQIFIPLCGKSLDLAWFASQAYSVLGVECSEKAIREFFLEQNLEIQTGQLKKFKAYNSVNIKLLQGDFFKLDRQILKDVSIVYDRASLIALPDKMRQKYVELLSQTLPDTAEIFLITLDYNQDHMPGPPFSVNHDEVIRLYQSHYKIELIHEDDVINNHQKFKERGLNRLVERVYRIS